MKKRLVSIKTITSIVLISLMVSVAGCKSKKITLVGSGGSLKAKTQNEIVEDVLIHELDYKTITTKGSITINSKGFTAIFKLVKDEFIQASIRPILGIEAMRMDITPDKAVLIDRLGGRYAEVDINDPKMSELAAFNFFNLQALLTNKLFIAGNKEVKKENYDDFLIAASTEHYVLQVEDKNKFKYGFSVDASNRITTTGISLADEDMSLVWTYDQFVEDGQFVYPTNMIADINVKKKKFKVGISYSDLDINTEFNLDKSIPSRYKKVDIMELIGSYMKLK